MTQTRSNSDDPTGYGYQPMTAEEKRWWLMLVLLLAGVMLVSCARFVGEIIVDASPEGFRNTADVEAIVSTMRILGSFCFAAGLVERLTLAIEKLKS
jgi:hypothetical protein